MSGIEIDLQQVKELVRLVEKYGLAELAIEEGGVSVVVKGVSAPVQSPHAPVEAAPSPAISEAAEPEEEEAGNLVTIESPMVGVFYRSPSPDSPPFVDIGDEVEIGQTIGMIEAMKVFSEIPSEIAGVVVEIPGQNGKLARQGDPLFRLRTK
ncbi:MAG: biotin/lipoyl-containing protein [Armatimonadota bacterium]|nr:biotin/lipoyl-containing protein [Armatimonadota bacterium]